MGCDISLHAERPVSGGWELVEAMPRRCPSCSREEVKGCWTCTDPESEEAIGVPGKVRGTWYLTRNSTLFWALCGFERPGAGQSAPPIAPARGLPNDPSSELAVLFSRFGASASSPSWLSLRELTTWWGWNRPNLRMDAAEFLEALDSIQSATGRDGRIVFWFYC